MGIKGALTRVLTNWLPADEQARMTANLLAWLCADLPPAERQEKIEQLSPRLLGRSRKGQLGLRLVVYTHLLRLPPLRWLRQWVTLVEAHPSSLAARPASRWL